MPDIIGNVENDITYIEGYIEYTPFYKSDLIIHRFGVLSEGPGSNAPRILINVHIHGDVCDMSEAF